MSSAYGAKDKVEEYQDNINQVRKFFEEAEEHIEKACRFARNKKKCSMVKAVLLGARIGTKIDVQKEFYDVLENLGDDLYS